MALGLHNIAPAKGARKRKKRVGRGNASGHGTYSTKGLKGQKARASGGMKLRGLKARMQKIPKLRGFKSMYDKLAVVNIGDLEKKFNNNEVIDAKKLMVAGLIIDNRHGIKVLGEGKLTKSLTVKADQFSATAKEAILKAGGKAEVNKK